jgi:phosphoenolpyruvate carboxykinase (ATP)
MLNAALEGKLDDVEYVEDPVFGFEVPTSVPGVPSELLIPRDTWNEKAAFDREARRLAGMFARNFEAYVDTVDNAVANAGPRV